MRSVAAGPRSRAVPSGGRIGHALVADLSPLIQGRPGHTGPREVHPEPCKLRVTRIRLDPMSTRFSPLARIATAGLIAAALVGCAIRQAEFRDYTRDAQRRIATQDWEGAYRTLEDGLGAKDAATRTLVYDLIASRPEIKQAADASFGPDALAKSFSGFGIGTALLVERRRLEYYSTIASDEELALAIRNLQQAHGNAKAARQQRLDSRQDRSGNLIVEEHTWRQLTPAQQSAIQAGAKPLVLLPTGSVGRVRTARVIDERGEAERRAANEREERSQAAARMGRGAMVAMLITAWLQEPQQDTTPSHLIEYELTLPDASVTTAMKASSQRVAHPADQCLYTDELEPAPGYLCQDSPGAFLERAGQPRTSPEQPPSGA